MKYVPYFIENEVQQSCQKFLERINCNKADVMGCLQDKDVDTLMEFPSNSTFDLTTYWMVKDTPSLSPVLPDNPLQLLTEENVKKVPIIVGITKDDGVLTIILDPRLKHAFEFESTSTLMTTMGLATKNITEEDIRAVNVMKRFYLSEGSYEDNEKNLLAMATDSWFGSPAAEVAKLHTILLAPMGVLSSWSAHA